MVKTKPLRSRFLKFYFRERLGQRVQKDLAFIVQCSERILSNWFNGSVPSDQSLMEAVLGIRNELDLPFEGGGEDGNRLIEAYHFIRQVETRSASPDDPIPALSISFLRKEKLVDARGEPTDKLIRWLNSKPPPLLAPRYISRKQAYTESEATSAIWLNPHNHYSLPLVGREAELDLLDNFLSSKERFKIAALVAPSGAGKTRLVSEWAKPYIVGDESEDWDAGFVESPNASLWSEENWQPRKNTLIIIDYTYNYADVIGAIMKRFEDGAPYDIRLLVLDHVLPEKLHQDTAFRKGVPSLGFREAKSDLFFETWPIALDPSSETQCFLLDIIAAAADPFTKDKSNKDYHPDSPQVIAAANALFEIGAIDEATIAPHRIKQRDAIRHPLFAALFGQLIRLDPETDFATVTRRDLVGHYFENKRRLPWRMDAEDPQIGYWVGFYVSIATLLRGLSVNDILEFQDNSSEMNRTFVVKDRFYDLLDISGRFVSSLEPQVIRPLEPDILGESFILKFLGEHQASDDFLALASALTTFCKSARLENPVGFFQETIQRMVRNLINEDQSLDEVKEAWRILDRFLDPKWFSEGSEIRQVISILIGFLVQRRKEAGLEHGNFSYANKVILEDLIAASKRGSWSAAARSAIRVLDLRLEQDHDVSDTAFSYVRVLENFKRQIGSGHSISSLAAANGNLRALKYVRIFFDENLDDCGNDGWTPLMFATYFKHLHVVDWLLNQGVNVNVKSTLDGADPLIIACQVDSYDIAARLVAGGAHVNYCPPEVYSSAWVSAFRNLNDSIQRLLISSGFRIEGNNELFHSLARGAIECGQINQMVNLIDAGIDLSFQNDFFAPLIVEAAQKGEVEILRSIIEAGADVNTTWHCSSLTALIACAIFGCAQCTRLLLLNGACCDFARPESRNTALMTACESWKVSWDADTSPFDERAAFDETIPLPKERAFKAVVYILLYFGADPEKKNSKGVSARDILAKHETLSGEFAQLVNLANNARSLQK